jgi:hypothetical protein
MSEVDNAMAMGIRASGLGLSLSVMIAGCQAPGPVRKAAGWPTPQPVVYRCFRAAGPIRIDGRLDETAWQRAEVITRLYQPVTLKPPSDGGEVRLLWDDENLYIGGRLQDKDVYAMLHGHDVRTWDDDVFEVFIKPSETQYPYYEFHVTPFGATLDLMFARRGAGTDQRFMQYNSGMKAAATVQGTLNDWHDVDEGWTAEMAIPLKSLGLSGSALKPGTTVRFAVCRYNYSVHLPPGEIGSEALEYSSTARLPKLAYHLYEYYDILRFEGTKP